MTETLGDRMKNYELQNEKKIKPYELFIVRLDGKCFSSFSKYFIKPFDDNFVKAMALTTKDLIEYFEAQTGYTHSDEITLIFNAKCSEEEFPNLNVNHTYDGRIQKILSLTSAYCSTRFNYHIFNIINDVKNKTIDYNINLLNLLQEHKQIFDARILIFNEENKYEILNHQIWRVRDCTRNCILTYGHTYLGKKIIHGKKTNEILEMLKENVYYNITNEKIPFHLKYGLYCKKFLNEEPCLRTKFIFTQFEINFSNENLNMLLNKYWEQDFLNNTKIYEIVNNNT